MNESTENGLVEFWTRLRRRKVVQWGLVYVVGAWGLLQGIGFVVDAFHWPDATKQVATLALFLGLPIVLVLAWYHGDRGHQRVSATELAIIALLCALGGGILWRYERVSETTATAEPPPPTAVAAATDHSIAVLPFVNMRYRRRVRVHRYESCALSRRLPGPC